MWLLFAVAVLFDREKGRGDGGCETRAAGNAGARVFEL